MLLFGRDRPIDGATLTAPLQHDHLALDRGLQDDLSCRAAEKAPIRDPKSELGVGGRHVNSTIHLPPLFLNSYMLGREYFCAN